jgi:acyl carrier protein
MPVGDQKEPEGAGGFMSPEVESRILDVITREGMIDRAKLTSEATLESLGVTSVDVVHILLGLEEEFNIYVPVDGALSEVKNIDELIAVIKKIVGEKAQA